MERNAFQNLCLASYGTYLGLVNYNRLDLDVFLSQEIPYTFNSNKCCNFQHFNYPQVLFACWFLISSCLANWVGGVIDV